MKVFQLEYENLEMDMRFTVDLFQTEELARKYCELADILENKKNRTPINLVRNGDFGGSYYIKEREVKTKINIV